MNFKTCDKCKGKGWLHGPGWETGQDDQKYLCDRCDGEGYEWGSVVTPNYTGDCDES